MPWKLETEQFEFKRNRMKGDKSAKPLQRDGMKLTISDEIVPM